MRTTSLCFTLLAIATICCNAAIGSPTLKIMCLGDSITEGTAAGGYRSRLCADLVSVGYDFSFVGSSTTSQSSILTTAGQIHHEGHGGYRIAQIEDNLDSDNGMSGNNGGYWLAGTQGRAAAYPDMILMQIGTNDVQPGVTAETIRDRLDSLIGHVFTDRPQTTLIVASLTPTHYLHSTFYEETTVAFNALIPDLVSKYAAEGRKAYFLATHSKLNTSDITDTVHPNQTGYDKMGDAWFGAIMTVPEPNAVIVLITGVVGFWRVLWQKRKRGVV
jgi:lysophospholipase L1-like esterase